MQLKGKRLLYIGGSASIYDIADYTTRHGIHLVTAGLKISDEVIRLSKEQYIIDTSNKEELSRVIQEHNIDGILVIGNEDVISCIVEIAEKLNIHFYVNKAQWNELQNKKNFKKNCKLYGIPIVDTYELNREEDIYSISENAFPLLLKPTDSCGSKGITICNSKENLFQAIKKAKSFSKSGTFLCERYMDCPEITIKYLFDQGEVYLWEVNDRYVNREQEGVGAIANVTVYPSKYLQLYLDTIHEKMVKMLKAHKMYNGTMFIQAFVDKDTIRPYDPGIRFGGGLSQFITKRVFGVNPLEFMINAALVEKMTLEDHSKITMIKPDMNGRHIANYSVLVKSGTIGDIKGLDRVKNMPEVFNVIQLLDIGDSITMIGTLKQVFARFHIEACSREKLKEIMSEIYETIEIFDVDGKSLKLHQIIDII